MVVGNERRWQTQFHGHPVFQDKALGVHKKKARMRFKAKLARYKNEWTVVVRAGRGGLTAIGASVTFNPILTLQHS